MRELWSSKVTMMRPAATPNWTCDNISPIIKMYNSSLFHLVCFYYFTRINNLSFQPSRGINRTKMGHCQKLKYYIILYINQSIIKRISPSRIQWPIPSTHESCMHLRHTQNTHTLTINTEVRAPRRPSGSYGVSLL